MNTTDHLYEEIKGLREKLKDTERKLTKAEDEIKTMVLKLEEYEEIVSGLRQQLGIVRVPMEGTVQ